MNIISQDKKLKGIKKLIGSFKYAFTGIKTTIKSEKNFRIDILVSIVVLIFGIILKINIIEWLILIIMISLVLSFELINTAIEKTIDINVKEYNDLAKIAKDTSAASVLILAIGSVIIGLFIFLPKIIELI